MTEGNIDKDLKELLEKEVVSLLKEQLIDYEVKLRLADQLADLMLEGECPWREGTEVHDEWWGYRVGMAGAYKKLRRGTSDD